MDKQKIKKIQALSLEMRYHMYEAFKITQQLQVLMQDDDES